jgi:hypothetical protein
MCTLGSSTVKPHDSVGSRRACACSEAGFSSQNGECVSGVYYRRAAFFFCMQKDSVQRIFIKKWFLFAVGSVFRVKRFTAASRNSLKDIRKSQMMIDQVRSG